MDQEEHKFDEQPASSSEAWEEVGRQFQALGESLATAFRTAWEREETRQHVQQIRQGVEAMVSEVSQAIREGSASTEAQQVREEAKKVVHDLRNAGEGAFQEAQPHLVSALRQVNRELQKLIERLEE